MALERPQCLKMARSQWDIVRQEEERKEIHDFSIFLVKTPQR